MLHILALQPLLDAELLVEWSKGKKIIIKPSNMKLCTGATGLVMETRMEFPSAYLTSVDPASLSTSVNFVQTQIYMWLTLTGKGAGVMRHKRLLAYLGLKLPGTQLGRLKG
jgi:hypothetical protein